MIGSCSRLNFATLGHKSYVPPFHGPKGLAGVLLLLLLSIHTGLLAWSAYRHSPVVSEVPNLPAGISHWHLGRFDLQRVNPPLVRMVGAFPILLLRPQVDWRDYSTDPTRRTEFAVAMRFLQCNSTTFLLYFRLARFTCIPFSWIGALACYYWAAGLYGTRSGLGAACLWCFSPSVLANASLLMPDIPAAALCVLTLYLNWRWLMSPSWSLALSVGLSLGTGLLCKTTLAAFYPLLPSIWIIYRCARPAMQIGWPVQAAMLSTALACALLILNMGYAFEGTFTPARDYTMRSGAFAASGRCLREHWPRPILHVLRNTPLPLPSNYLYGIDAQLLDFDIGAPSYVAGKWHDRGLWYFYLYCMCVKAPVGTLVLLLLSGGLTIYGKAHWPDELALLLPLLGLTALISSQTGFSVHFRYIFPALPLGLIWASKPLACGPYVLRASAGICLLGAVTSSLANYPHSLSYFNEVAGGAPSGHWCLLDSSISCGQDLLLLKEWDEARPKSEPLYIAVYSVVDPAMIGVHFDPIPATTPLPKGWYAIDVNFLQGATRFAPDGVGSYYDPGDLRHFSRTLPDSVIGHSIYIFHVH